MIFGSSCFHEVFSDPPKMNSSSLYHFSKFLSLLYFSVVDFAILCSQHVCIFDSDLLKWICNVLKFYTLQFVVLMRFVACQYGNRPYALLTLPPIAHCSHHTSLNKPTPSKQNIPTPTPYHLIGGYKSGQRLDTGGISSQVRLQYSVCKMSEYLHSNHGLSRMTISDHTRPCLTKV